MPIDVNGYTPIYPSPDTLSRDTQPKPPPPVENQQERNQPRQQINRDVLERRVNEREKATEVSLQRFRETEELPRQTQAALNTYESTARNDIDEDGGELVGVDIFI